ncbi:inactive serine protease PAMR1 isoform X1 [Scleropages formosus]|uniref:Inactive serine protease PAMR1 n=1 Tax=Scleropages formosus TaxID=113540 RepID=A0A8C9R1X0_SCLFO|nr:inactive serine protease PAMR1 isoform X1 [Scleropages formosus]
MLSVGHQLVMPSQPLLFLLILLLHFGAWGSAWPHDYRLWYDRCPGAEWNVMCRGCCEYDLIRCKCPALGTTVGYAVPCCRNALNECDPCIIHPGCSIFENCKRCNNGTWAAKDDFFVRGKYCAECRPGWSGGDCMRCGGVIRKAQGHIVLESYPTNARCEWTLHVDPEFTVELRFRMLSLEFDHSCRYDYVEVRDGDDLSSRLIGRFCGNERPPPIHSSGSSLHILFVSDGYKNFDGFFATFQESSACSSSPCLHDGTCILDSVGSFRCACLAGYTGPRCENVVLCSRPPVPAHGATEGLHLHFGARVTFRCDPGFTLQGVHSATCRLDGTWSAAAPSCVPREKEKSCPSPEHLANGDYFLVYGGNVLIAVQYMCRPPFVLKGQSQRTCLPNNTWSGTAPACVRVKDVDVEQDSKGSGSKKGTSPAGGKDADGTMTFVGSKNATVGLDKSGSPDPGKEKEKDSQTTNETERRRCPPPPRLHNGYHQLVLGLDGAADMVEFFCNNSYALSGTPRMTCLLDGTWSGKQPLCVRACREPKVSELVRQRVLPPQAPFRKTPVHKFYSSANVGKSFDPFIPTKGPPVLPDLPQGFHHLYTQIEYECVSPFYQHSGSSRRTCLKTGKWSGRHVSCSPVCGKLAAFNARKPAEVRWPWHAAIYRRSAAATKMLNKDIQAAGLGKGSEDEAAAMGKEPEVEDAHWQLVCSGALVNQRSVVVAAHCVTELGKAQPLSAANVKVVVGKHYRSDLREPRSLQHLRVSTILVHPNFDPLVLDSDLAVLKLLDKARVGERVLPVCLPEAQIGQVAPQHAFVLGWSILPAEGGAGATNETVRAGLVELADVVSCERQFARHGVSVGVTDNMLCGRQHPRALSDICPADTGGIVVMPTPSYSPQDPEWQHEAKHVWSLLGLVSFGYEQHSCSPDLYTVYTRVSSFQDWIQKNMK